MMSCVKNVRKLLRASAPDVYVAWQGKRLLLQPLWLRRGTTELPRLSQFTCIEPWAEDPQVFAASALCLAGTPSLTQSNLGVTVLPGRSRRVNCSKSCSVWGGKKLFLAQTPLPVMGHEHLLSKRTPAEFTDVSRLWITFTQLISRNLISRYSSVQTTRIPQGEMPKFQLLFLNCTCVREGANKTDTTAVIQKTPREAGSHRKTKCARDSLEGSAGVWEKGNSFFPPPHLKRRMGGKKGIAFL